MLQKFYDDPSSIKTYFNTILPLFDGHIVGLMLGSELSEQSTEYVDLINNFAKIVNHIEQAVSNSSILFISTV